VLDDPSQGRAPDPTELAEELARLRTLARAMRGPLGLLIANLGFALEEISGLGVELNPTATATATEESLVARVARAQSALSAVGDALREARKGADQVTQLSRDLLGPPPESRAARETARGAGAGCEAVPSNSSSKPSTTVRGRILVVDDEPMIVRAIQRLLEGEHEITLSTDPIAVVEQVRAGRRFDVILCDLMMPTMSGIDVYNAIRQMDADQARRIVFMTGGAFTERALAFLAATENARIEKPLERSTLRAAIRAAVLMT
jgi:CheY-like chemotaxis protein